VQVGNDRSDKNNARKLPGHASVLIESKKMDSASIGQDQETVSAKNVPSRLKSVLKGYVMCAVLLSLKRSDCGCFGATQRGSSV
jgi:hypothetical protein